MVQHKRLFYLEVWDRILDLVGLDNWASRACRLGAKKDTFVLTMTKLCV